MHKYPYNKNENGSTYYNNKRFDDYYDMHFGEPARLIVRRKVDRYGGARSGFEMIDRE